MEFLVSITIQHLELDFGSISAKEVYDGINNNEISLEPNPYLD